MKTKGLCPVAQIADIEGGPPLRLVLFQRDWKGRIVKIWICWVRFWREQKSKGFGLSELQWIGESRCSADIKGLDLGEGLCLILGGLHGSKIPGFGDSLVVEIDLQRAGPSGFCFRESREKMKAGSVENTQKKL